MTLALDQLLRSGGRPIAVLVAIGPDAHAPALPDREPRDQFEEHRLFTVERAGEDLSVSRDAVFTLIASGQLRSIKIGASRRVPRLALVEYVQQQLHADVTDEA